MRSFKEVCMYAVIKVGSSQYKISEGDTINVVRTAKEEGKSVSLDKILLFADGKDIRIGQPFVKGIKVAAKVMRHFLDDKKITFKFRKRKESKTTRGHRQQLTALSITKISAE